MNLAPPTPQLLNRLSQIDNILLVLSGKGGVGKSSLSVQLALSLLTLEPNARVGLLDVDLTGPSLPRMLGLEGRDVLQSSEGWVPVYLDVDGQERRDEHEATGGRLAVMSMAFLLASSRDSVVWRGPKKNSMIKQFLSEVRWGKLDYLIVDTPPGTSDEHISLLETLRPLLLPSSSVTHLPLPSLSSVLVTTPQALALLDVSKELSFIRRTQTPLLGLVENMSGYACPHCGDIVGVFGQKGGESFCTQEGIKFLGRVPVETGLTGLLEGGPLKAGDEGGLRSRYEKLGSSKIVTEVVKDIVKLLALMKSERDAADGLEGLRMETSA